MLVFLTPSVLLFFFLSPISCLLSLLSLMKLLYTYVYSTRTCCSLAPSSFSNRHSFYCTVLLLCLKCPVSHFFKMSSCSFFTVCTGHEMMQSPHTSWPTLLLNPVRQGGRLFPDQLWYCPGSISRVLVFTSLRYTVRKYN